MPSCKYGCSRGCDTGCPEWKSDDNGHPILEPPPSKTHEKEND